MWYSRPHLAMDTSSVLEVKRLPMRYHRNIVVLCVLLLLTACSRYAVPNASFVVTVQTNTGQPIEGIGIGIDPHFAPFGNIEGGVITNAHGRATVSLSPGSYTLFVQPGGFSRAAQDVIALPNATTAITLTVTP